MSGIGRPSNSIKKPGSWQRTLAYLLRDIAGIYLAVLAGVFVFQRSVIYKPSFPVASPAAAGAPSMRVIQVRTADDLRLVGWYQPAASPARPVIVFFHGNAGSIGTRAYKIRDFLRAGYGVLLAEYRGYNNNPGRPSEAGLYSDAHAYLDWLGAQGVPQDRIVLMGESLGTGVAVQMSLDYPQARALVLEAPYTSLPDVAALELPMFPAHLLALDHFASLEKIKSIRMPVLVIHGLHDGIVPAHFGQALYAAAPAPKKLLLLPGAGHNDLYAYKANDAVMAFLGNLPLRLPTIP